MLNLRDVREFAAWAHREQQYDGRPYVIGHLDRVVLTLVLFNTMDLELLAAGYTHDTVEDTDVTVEELAGRYGTGVATLTDLVTDNKTAPNRRARQQATYTRMRSHPDGSRARKLKLADRIANVEASLRADGKSFFGMYRKEYDFFRAMLFVEEEHPEMWAHLDALMASEWRVV